MKRLLLVVVLVELIALAAAGLWAQNTVELRGRLTDKIWLPAATCDSTPAAYVSLFSLPTTPAHAIPTCNVGTNTVQATLDFADAVSRSAQTIWHVPADWTSTVDARFYWYTSVTSGNVVWQLATICVADAETGDPAFNTASTVIDAAKGTTLQFNLAAITTVTVTGCAAGEVMFVKVLRDAGHASDTLAGTAKLLGLELTYRRAI